MQFLKSIRKVSQNTSLIQLKKIKIKIFIIGLRKRNNTKSIIIIIINYYLCILSKIIQKSVADAVYIF